MTSEIPDSVIQWHRVRKKGKLHFMLLFGSAWFFLMGLLYFGLFVTYGMKASPHGKESWVLLLVLWPASCVVLAFCGWYIKEAKYRRYKDAFDEGLPQI